MKTNWRKLNGIPVLAAREGRRRKRVKDRPLAEMVAEYLAKGGQVTVGEPKWANGATRDWTGTQLLNGWVGGPREDLDHVGGYSYGD